jgi:hypothetical protein
LAGLQAKVSFEPVFMYSKCPANLLQHVLYEI